jgi:hypothetical protein
MGTNPPLYIPRRGRVQVSLGFRLRSTYTVVHEYLAAVWMDLTLSHREESMELQPLLDAAATT